MSTRGMDAGKARGLVDKMVGLGKEVVGVVINNDRLQDEGNRQQAKGAASLKALRKEGEAKAKETKAEAMERKERAAQRAKSSA